MKTIMIFIAIVAIIYWLFAKVFNTVRTKSNETARVKQGLLPTTWIIPAVSVALIAILMFVVAIPAQECGVVVTPSGVKQETYNTGWHFVAPWYKVRTMDKTAQVFTCANSSQKNEDGEKQYQSGAIWTPTSDGIKMGFAISASWRIDPNYAWWIYDNVSEMDGASNGRFYWLEDNVIKAKLKSALALTTSSYTPIEVYSNKREEIQQKVFEKMSKDIMAYHLILEQIDIREVYYNSDYEKSINAKKLAEQEALRLIEVTKQLQEKEKQATIQKNIEITAAQAEAEALRIKGQSISSNPRVVELEWINKWNGELPTYMTGNGQGVMFMMNK